MLDSSGANHLVYTFEDLSRIVNTHPSLSNLSEKVYPTDFYISVNVNGSPLATTSPSREKAINALMRAICYKLKISY
jgi:hypothetical protein